MGCHGTTRRLLLAAACALPAAGACSESPERAVQAPPARDAGPLAPMDRVARVLRGTAIWYGADWHGKRTASGLPFDRHAFTAAHRTLPLESRVRVTNLENGSQVVVEINDRGPYGRDRSRIIDLSEAAARQLGFLESGSARVELEVLEPVGARGSPGAPTAPARGDLRP